MHVYKDTDSTVVFRHSYPGFLNANIYRGNILVGTRFGFPNVANTFSIPLTYQETEKAGALRIEWTDNIDFTRTQVIDVVTPIAPLDYIETTLRESGQADSDVSVFNQQVKDLENTARLLIEAYTGMKFSAVDGVRYATGAVNLAKLLQESVRVDSINPPLTYDLNQAFTIYNIKQAPPEDFTPGFDGVIRVPKDYWENVHYVVAGTWGVDRVPAAIEEAAMILIAEMGCSEKIYRDRYLQVVRYGTNSFQFNDRAYEGTGNVKADQLLEPYRRGGMIVV